MKERAPLVVSGATGAPTVARSSPGKATNGARLTMSQRGRKRPAIENRAIYRRGSALFAGLKTYRSQLRRSSVVKAS